MGAGGQAGGGLFHHKRSELHGFKITYMHYFAKKRGEQYEISLTHIMRWEVLGCGVEDWFPSGSPAGQAAVNGVVVTVMGNEATVGRWRGELSTHRRTQKLAPQVRLEGLGPQHRTEGTRDSRPRQFTGGRWCPAAGHGYFAFIYKDFISYNKHGFLL